MGRHLWVLLILAGFMALSGGPETLDTINAASIAFMAFTSVGAAMWLSRLPGLRWIAASFPFWAMTDAAQWPEFVALGLTFAGMAMAAVGPTLPSRRVRRKGSAMPHLASGALTPVVARNYPAARTSNVLYVATITVAVIALLCMVLTAVGWNTDVMSAFAIASTIIAVTFAFSNWFATRLRLRIDERGLHSRIFFRETTLPWSDISDLSLRYVFLGVGVRVVYYIVRTPTREFAFPSSMKDAQELRNAIEAATGLGFPNPEIEANF